LVYDWLLKLHQKAFPAHCRLCRAPGERGLELCGACRKELPWLDHACRGCAMPLPPEASVTMCPRCQISDSPIDQCRALFTYHPPVDGWIQGLKFEQDLALGRLLGGLLADSLPLDTRAASVSVLPVPLHRKRLSERGYNQALEIARPLTKCGYQIETHCCKRARNTGAQSGLSAASRKGNMRGAFSANQRLDGKRFILIDDVLTTGTTLMELARCLKSAGAESVIAWAVARATLNTRQGA
jgi:ComF family protein